jgi:hypothetical protein
MTTNGLSAFGRGGAWWIFFILNMALQGLGQTTGNWQLEKMPVDLETDLALSSLPPHLRSGATVYLLDPGKGFYVGKKGTNGFVCFISRTEWEWGEFRQDLAAPISYDAEGARTIMPLYLDAAAMRASGKYTPTRLKDTMLARIRRGYYKAPSRPGISYMEAPVMRVYVGNPDKIRVATMNMPHYMYYVPYLSNADIGVDPNASQAPYLVNPGAMLLGGERKAPYGYLISPLNEAEKAKIVASGQALLKRLEAYKAYFKTGGMAGHH